MREPVPPVVGEIDEHEGDEPGDDAVACERDEAQSVVEPSVGCEERRPREDDHHLLADAAAEVGERVLEAVDTAPPLRAGDEQLEADEEEEERDREGDVVADLHGEPLPSLVPKDSDCHAHP